MKLFYNIIPVLNVEEEDKVKFGHFKNNKVTN